MKRTCFLFLSFFNALLFLTSCKKDKIENNGGADIVLEGSGFLCTIGVGRSGHSDTLTYYFRAAGEEMVGYLSGAQVPEQHVSFEKRSNNTIAIKRTVPYHSVNRYLTYFGTQKNPNPATSSFPHEYLFYHYETTSEETDFIVKRSSADIHKFTIESQSHPGNFLGVAKWVNATYPTEANLVFTSKKQEFFFMQQ